MHISPKLAPFAVLTTFKTGEQVRVHWMEEEGAQAQATNDRRVSSVKSAIVERNDGTAFVPLEPAAQAAPSVVWVVVIDHRHGTDVYAAATEDAAWKVAAEYARESWAERFPETDAPADDREAVSQYFEDHNNEWRIIERVTVQGAADQGKA